MSDTRPCTIRVYYKDTPAKDYLDPTALKFKYGEFSLVASDCCQEFIDTRNNAPLMLITLEEVSTRELIDFLKTYNRNSSGDRKDIRNLIMRSSINVNGLTIKRTIDFDDLTKKEERFEQELRYHVDHMLTMLIKASSHWLRDDKPYENFKGRHSRIRSIATKDHSYFGDTLLTIDFKSRNVDSFMTTIPELLNWNKRNVSIS